MFKVLLCVTQQHDWRLVLVAAAVCVAATLATFFLYSKTPEFPQWRRWIWLSMTGLVAGSGIWTTHFVAMLAFETGLPTGYDAVSTLGSLVVAIAGTTLGFALAAASPGGHGKALRTLGGGLVVGLSITLMHYVGMIGYRTQGVLHWDGIYVAGSVLVGAVLAGGALYLVRPGDAFRRQALGAGLLTLAIVGMHFTGMTAVTIVPDASRVVPLSEMSNAIMIAIAVAVSAVIMVTAIAGVAFDNASRNGNLKRLREALDAMPEGLAFYDASDRLVAWNTQYADLCHDQGLELVAGLQFEQMLQTSLIHGAYPEARGREVEWLAERRNVRRGSAASLTQLVADGRWLRITERRTSDGGTVSVNVDITDLKRAENEAAAARDRAQEAVRRAEFAESLAHLGHWRVDAASGELTWSRQMYGIFGLPMDRPLVREAVQAMSHPDDTANVQNLMARLLSGQCDSADTVNRIYNTAGELRYLAVNCGVERAPDGTILGIFGTMMDVTEQKKAEAAIARARDEAQEQARRAGFAENLAHLGSWRLDVAAGELTWSKQTYAIYGLPLDEPLSFSTIVAMTHPDDLDAVSDLMERLSRGETESEDALSRIYNRSGDLRYLAVNSGVERGPDGQVVAVVGSMMDITDQKRLESELRQAQALAEEAAAVKGEFLANMSHELRTPLTSIIGFTGLAVAQRDLPPLARNYIERVEHASRALLCTVNDILDFSKLEAGQVSIQVQPVSVTKLVKATFDLFGPQAGAKDLNLNLEMDAEDWVVQLDPDRIRQILLNLIGNAVKFTAAGSVTLRAHHAQDTQTLLVEVIDTGAGISEDKVESLFRRFSQIDGSLTRSQGGTGLGLAICKGLVEAMGGEIGVTSQLGQGSRFWFSLPAPLADQAEQGANGQTAAPVALVGLRVLVVDDHPTNRELARLFLTGAGAEVSEACDGQEAIEQADDWPYDLILMDLQMPRLDGRNALKRLRCGNGPNATTPVLAFTAAADSQTNAQLIELGFDDVVAKPLDAEALIAAAGRATAFLFEYPAMEQAHDG